MRRTKTVTAVIVGTAVGMLLIGALGLPARAAARPVGTLRVGDEVFWDGQRIRRSGSSNPCLIPFACVDAEPDPCPADVKCFHYKLEVAQGGGRLRVGIDSPDADDWFDLYLYDPEGELVAENAGAWSAEVFEKVKAAGDYTVTVAAPWVRNGFFRVRAKLEPWPRKKHPGPVRAMLPNIRLTPPFEFTFASPSFTPLGEESGCIEDEMVEHSPTRCLRFSLGPENVGDGPLELRYEPREGDGIVTKGTIYQRIHYSNGKIKERKAGRYEYHKTHAHFHHAGFGRLELLRVTDPQRGRLEPAGRGPKQGYCMAPYVIVNWFAFDNDPAYTAESSCMGVDPATGTTMGLERGWADIYSWFLSGNYVDFGDNPDGLYVVRSKNDATNDILETDESDNWAYAYIRVQGEEIAVLERGYGKSPWDRDRVEAPEWLQPVER